MVLCESEPDIVEGDRAEHFPEVTWSLVTSMQIDENDHGLELENDHPPDDVGNVQPEPVRNEPPQTRSRSRKASRRLPS